MEQNKVYENLYNSLKELGLNGSEINLYTVSLNLGPSPISAIAKHLNISRPNIYKTIQALERVGLAKFSEKEKFARNFMVESPTIVLDKLRKKKESISILDNNLVSELPDLLARYHQGEGPTKIKVMKGKEQYIKIFNQSVEEENKEIQFCGSTEDFINFVSWGIEREWIKKRMKKNVSIKVLTTPSFTADELIKKDKDEKRETKILKDAGQFPSSFMLFANKVVIWQPKAPLVILIEDQFITQMMKSIFDKLWR